ncbi:MAG: gamma-glutamyl-gamma-aminobutyrate hydrolase family protein [Lawsonibacter sp.]|nr:gamma-glutamyl-gamma-aminobutyrate hydrolase family protein [Lawsonibacter sp.]
MTQKRFRKFLSLLLALAAMLGLTVTTAAAADTGVTRGEMAAILVETAGFTNQKEAYAAKACAFQDVAEGSEYEGWINLAYEAGLVSGSGNGCFYPDDEVSQVEAAAMILRYAGVPDVVFNTWPKDYNTAAVSTGLTGGFSFDPDQNATEDMVRQMIHNAAAIEGKPFIGISWKNNDQDYTKFHKIVALSGGVAVELPQITGRAEADAVVSGVDGVIVTGGEDINPDRYGEDHSPLLEDNNAQRDIRDNSDYNLIQAALEEDLPMLCICRGMQMLNVACGGGLMQDLPTYLGKDSVVYVTHRYKASGDYARHDITVEENSKWLEDIIGGSELASVASWHHQAANPERVGNGLTVAAYGPEHIIEAVEYQANTFALGIQFHPERDVLGEDALCDVGICRHFFETLVDFASDKPVIGVSWGGDHQDSIDLHRIIRKAGGVTVRMPQITTQEEAVAALSQVDGVILTGGEDINPDRYGEVHSPLLEDNTAYREVRDTSDYQLIKAALGQDVPMLAICRGMQMLNVVCGGGLIQDLPTYLEKDSTYRVHRNAPDWARHEITVTKNSAWLHDIVGGYTLNDVASWHHQAVNPKRVGTGLTVAAYGPDDVIESVEYQRNEFALGVQFHPEADAMESGTFLTFFDALVEHAAA